MTRNNWAKLSRDERGMSLVELLVYMALLLIVVAVVGSLLASSASAQRTVQDSSTVVQSAKLVTQSVTQGIRNSLARSIQNVGATGDQILRAKHVIVKQSTAVPAPAPTKQWVCLAWYFDSSSGKLFSARSATGAVTTPSEAALQTAPWVQLGSGLAPLNGATGIFSGTSPVKVDFIVKAGSRTPSAYSTTIAPLPIPLPTGNPTAEALTCS